jgi:hypothetical protein
VELAKKTRALEDAATGKEQHNLMEVAGHMLTHRGIDDTQVDVGPPVIVDDIPPFVPPADPEKDPEDVYGDDTKPDFGDE